MSKTIDMIASQDIKDYRQKPVKKDERFPVDAEHVELLTTLGWATTAEHFESFPPPVVAAKKSTGGYKKFSRANTDNSFAE